MRRACRSLLTTPAENDKTRPSRFVLKPRRATRPATMISVWSPFFCFGIRRGCSPRASQTAMSRFVVTDRGFQQDALKASALDDQDAIRLGDLDLHSDHAALRLEVVTADGALSTTFERRDA